MAVTNGTRTTLWIVGVILLVQGFGSTLTEAVWHSSFGASGILVGLGAPTWISWVIGAAGVVVLIAAAIRHKR